MQELDSYFRALEARDEYMGVVLVTRGDERLFDGVWEPVHRVHEVVVAHGTLRNPI